MVKLIVHIGMGKTGTTSIQVALNKNKALLEEQRAKYLGMWFNAIRPEYAGYSGQQIFFQSSPEVMVQNATALSNALLEESARTGIDTFILSNEEIYSHSPCLPSFVETLGKTIEPRFIAYVRDPGAWLPSAYNQWGIYHKFNAGSIIPYEERARELVKVYGGLILWKNLFGELLTVRPFSRDIDVVQDFASTAGIRLESGAERVFERVEPAETLLRAIYNNRFPDPVLPFRFEDAIGRLDLQKSAHIPELVENCFNYDETDTIISERRNLFDFIRDNFGIDYTKEPGREQPHVDLDKMRERLMDHLVHIVLDQADRISALEATLKKPPGS